MCKARLSLLNFIEEVPKCLQQQFAATMDGSTDFERSEKAQEMVSIGEKDSDDLQWTPNEETKLVRRYARQT